MFPPGGAQLFGLMYVREGSHSSGCTPYPQCACGLATAVLGCAAMLAPRGSLVPPPRVLAGHGAPLLSYSTQCFFMLHWGVRQFL